MVSFSIAVWVVILSLQYNNVMTRLIPPPQPLSHNFFDNHLLLFMLNNKTTENIVYSPVSVYTSLTLAYVGAEGRTAEELSTVLNLQQADKKLFASKYGDFLKTTFRKSKTESNAPQLPMINRLYVDNNIEVVKNFSKIARNNFNCETEYIDFSQVSMATNKINKWIEQQTENEIKNIIQPNAINNNIRAILINAIYFEAKWLHPFLRRYTEIASFHISDSEEVKVNLMLADDQFGYYESSELNAKILEMPFENSDISMLIMLPEKKSSLAKLEKSLTIMDLNNITSKLVKQKVAVVLPKFRIEYDFNLKETLEKMGCSSMFAENANLTGIFGDAESQQISDIKHKAVLDFNEAGSNVDVSNKIEKPLFLAPGQKNFIAIRPFFFVIRSKSMTLFTGHVARF